MTAHSSLGASVMPRLIHCAGSLQMSEGAPRTTSVAAETGTAVHEVGEMALKLSLDAYDFVGSKTSNGIIVSDDMAEAGQVYVSWVRTRFAGLHWMLEERVDLSRIYQGMFGTADLITYDESAAWLHVADYKNGRGLVEVDTAQLAYYAVGAVFKLTGKRINGITVHVVQPNAPHVDGPIRSKDYTMPDLEAWAQLFYKVAVDANSDNPTMKAGDHCHFCPARAYCATRIAHTLQIAMPYPTIKRMTDDQIVAVLQEANAIKSQLTAIEEYARQLALGGRHISNHKLVKANKHYVCKDESAFIEEVKQASLDADRFYKKQLVSRSVADKVAGPHNADLIKKHYIKPEGELQLVSMKDPRPAESVDKVPAGTFEPVNPQFH